MAGALIMALGRQGHFFHRSSEKKSPSSAEAGNHNKSTSSSRLQANDCTPALSGPGGVGKLFMCFWQKQITPVSPRLSARLHAIELMWVVHIIVCFHSGASDRKWAPQGRNPFTSAGCLLNQRYISLMGKSLLRCWKKRINHLSVKTPSPWKPTLVINSNQKKRCI